MGGPSLQQGARLGQSNPLSASCRCRSLTVVSEGGLLLLRAGVEPAACMHEPWHLKHSDPLQHEMSGKGAHHALQAVGVPLVLCKVPMKTDGSLL